MNYQIEFNPRAIKDFKKLSPEIQRRINTKLTSLQNNLQGDVKKLTNFYPEYRLRVGDYKILFEVQSDRVIIHRIKHRQNAY